MRIASSLPDALPANFTTAEALAAGVSAQRLRTSDLAAPFAGIRARGPAIALLRDQWSDLRQDAAHQTRVILALVDAYLPALRPDEFFSHTTAALLWGVPLPSLPDQRLHLSTHDRRTTTRKNGVHGHRLAPHTVQVTTLRGIPLTTPASTWASLGLILHHRDLVAAADALVRIDRQPWPVVASFPPRPPRSTLEELRQAAALKRPGAANLRKALPLVRTDSWSRPGTWTRLLTVEAGLPEPELNMDIFDSSGDWIACTDLAYPQYRVCAEYDGGIHFTDYRRSVKDIERRERLAAAGWRVVTLTKAHVFGSRPDAADRVRVALQQRGMII